MSESKEVSLLQKVCGSIESMAPKFAEALPRTMAIDMFKRQAIQYIQTAKDQDKLLNANRNTLYLAISKAASDGLLLDGREAALVVFGSEVQFMPMVQGLVKLARNSGNIKSIESQVVYSNDKFTYIMGQDESPKHEADWFGDRGKPVGVWAVVTLESGEKIPAMLSANKIDRIAKKSKNAYQYDSSKGDAWEEWWKKAAIKNVLKYAPRSTELDRAIQHDNEAAFVETIDQPTQEQPTNVVPIEEKKTRKKAVDKIKESAPVQEETTVVEAQYEEVPI